MSNEEPFTPLRREVRLQRHAAEQAQYTVSVTTPKIEPSRVCDQTGQDSDGDGGRRVQLSDGCQGSGRQEPGYRRKRQARLLYQHYPEQNGCAVLDEELGE